MSLGELGFRGGKKYDRNEAAIANSLSNVTDADEFPANRVHTLMVIYNRANLSVRELP